MFLGREKAPLPAVGRTGYFDAIIDVGTMI